MKVKKNKRVLKPHQPCSESEKCKTCGYKGYLSNNFVYETRMCCMYLLDTGEPRGCPSGDDCTRYIHEDELKKRKRYYNKVIKREVKGNKWKLEN